ncbi:hypothetical protein MRX96_004807 [Rhipicephalus microplus]
MFHTTPSHRDTSPSASQVADTDEATTEDKKEQTRSSRLLRGLGAELRPLLDTFHRMNHCSTSPKEAASTPPRPPPHCHAFGTADSNYWATTNPPNKAAFSADDFPNPADLSDKTNAV